MNSNSNEHLLLEEDQIYNFSRFSIVSRWSRTCGKNVVRRVETALRVHGKRENK